MELKYSNTGQSQIAHAAEVIPQIISVLLAELPPSMRSSALAKASRAYKGAAVPLSTLFPSSMSQDQIAQIYNGLVAMLQALGMGGPADSVQSVVARASSIASGQPFAGDPTSATADVPAVLAIAQLATSSPSLRGKSPDLDALCDQAEQLYQLYDCYNHPRYLGGSIFDGLKMVGQEIAGIFSEKKDLQGDYTRAKYRYERDPTAERKATLTDAANSLYSYLVKHDKDDDLLQDRNFLADVTISADEAISERADAGGTGTGAQDPDQHATQQTNDSSRATGLVPDAPKHGDAVQDPSGQTHPSRQDGAIPIPNPADIVSALQSTLASASSGQAQAIRDAATSTDARVRLSAALFWLTAPTSITSVVAPVAVPQTPTLRSLLRWCDDIKQAAVYGTLGLASAVAADQVRADQSSRQRERGLQQDAAHPLDAAESADIALSGVSIE